jgi:uncharacterized NAD(P)/FAD-binding protein YdhS
MISRRQPRVVIVGGGFSGTMTAVNLARLSEAPLQVTVVNQGYPQGRGIAYSTRRAEHLLNVVARNMSAFPDHPNHFVEWLRTRTEYVSVPDAELRETFMPRRVYGDYLRSVALHHVRAVDPRAAVAIDQIEDEVVDILPEPDGARLLLRSGVELLADKVVLATGNEPPADLPGGETLAGHPAWCANPWVDWETRLPADGSDIVLLGTGLTTVDAIITLISLGWKGTIHAVSRNGLLPQSHFKGIDDPHFPPQDVDLATLGLGALVKLIEQHCERLRSLGANPAMIVDKLRPHTQRIWQTFSDADRREFVTRYAARWNVMRHRIAPSIAREVAMAVEAGRLKIARAGISGVRADGDKVGVDLLDRDGKVSSLEAGLVINCTGPHTRFSATRSPLLQTLLRSGLAQPDSMDMGVRVENGFSVVGREGKRSPFLLALGPLLRGTLWESIAVPELRGQAMRVAQTILDEILPMTQLSPRRAPAAEPTVMEYWI